MASYDVAHIHEQGVDLIIIPLDRSFGHKPRSEQQEITATLEACAASAGLAGTVVPVWDAGGGRMAFLAPEEWHGFFRSIDLAFVMANVNRKLTCN